MTDLVDLSLTRQLAKRISHHYGDLLPIAAETERQVIAATLEQYQLAQVPLEDLDKPQFDETIQELKRPIRSIGLRLRPDFTQDQARMWVASMVEALTHLPPRPAISAAKEAKHAPLEHPSQVLKCILERSEPHISKLRRAERQLRKMLEMKDHPDRFKVSEPGTPELQALSHDELQAMPHHLRRMGIGAGWLSEDEDGVLRWTEQD